MHTVASDGPGRAVIVVSRFNEAVTRRLLRGALQTLEQRGLPDTNIDVIWVPGAFELPLVMKHAVATGRYDLAVALGAVIRGETPHFDYVCHVAAHGLAEVSRHTGVPIGFGVLTCDSMAQARARAGGEAGNKGAEAALAALETHAALAELNGRDQT